jgi:exodeoxyribonuclease VII large subunit
MYRSRAQLLPFRLAEGQRIEVRALVTLYEARGEFQLQIEAIRQAGRGNLFEAFLRLKERLATEGLFDEAKKRALPHLPRGIGIVTSPQAAALHDVLVALARRAPHVPRVVYPSPVQGAGAGASLAAMVAMAGARAAIDGIEVLIVCRGGGSLEDLWAFNDEALVRAIAACPIPVVSGVGHETDFTLADFVADLRAATPTAAAELVSAGHLEARTRLGLLHRELERRVRRKLDAAWERCDRARARLAHPRERIGRQRERFGALTHRLRVAIALRLERARIRQRFAAQAFVRHKPDLASEMQRTGRLALRLQESMARRLVSERQKHMALASHLAHLNPQAVLERGYAIVRNEAGEILRDADATQAGERLHIQPARGEITVRVETLTASGSSPAPSKG